MLVALAIELVRGSVVENHVAVVANCGSAEGPLSLHGNGIDRFGVSEDLAHGVSTISRDATSKLLAAVTDGNDALGLAIPGDVIEATADDAVLSSCVADVLRLPHLQHTGGIATGNLEAIGRESGDGGGGGVAGVLFAVGGVVDGANEDGLSALEERRGKTGELASPKGVDLGGRMSGEARHTG